MERILCALILLTSFDVYGAGIQSEQGKVSVVRVQYYRADTACFAVGNSRVFKLDLTQTKGTAALSLVLAANASGKDVVVQWDEDKPLEGGCDTGTTMYPLYSIRIL